MPGALISITRTGSCWRPSPTPRRRRAITSEFRWRAWARTRSSWAPCVTTPERTMPGALISITRTGSCWRPSPTPRRQTAITSAARWRAWARTRSSWAPVRTTPERAMPGVPIYSTRTGSCWRPSPTPRRQTAITSALPWQGWARARSSWQPIRMTPERAMPGASIFSIRTAAARWCATRRRCLRPIRRTPIRPTTPAWWLLRWAWRRTS